MEYEYIWPTFLVICPELIKWFNFWFGPADSTSAFENLEPFQNILQAFEDGEAISHPFYRLNFFGCTLDPYLAFRARAEQSE